MWDHGTGRSKGYGFVSYRTKEDAEYAIRTMNGEQVRDRVGGRPQPQPPGTRVIAAQSP